MAAPIYISYIPQATGDHVICYQQISPVNDGVNFCCITDSTPSVVGASKVFVIPDVLLNCAGNGGTGTGGTPWDGGTTTNFSGYVYPVCNSDLKVTWGPVQFTVVV